MGLTSDKIFSLYQNSVVKIISKGAQGTSQGSGVIIKEMNLIVTNFHVLNYNLDLKILLNNKDIEYDSLFAFDPTNDLLLIKLRESYPHESNSFQLTTDNKAGEIIYTIGYPLGFDATITNGLLNGLNSNHDKSFSTLKNFNKNWLRFDAPISEGNSGGALVNASGELIGITTSTHTKGQNINFAIPIGEVVNLYQNENSVDLPQELRHHFLLYSISFLAGNYTKALLHIDKCIQVSTGLSTYLFLSKKTHLLFLTKNDKVKSRLEKIIPQIEKLEEYVNNEPNIDNDLHLNHDLNILYYDIAEILFLEGNEQESLSYVNKGLKIYKYSSELNYLKSKILLKMNEYDDCLNSVDLAIDLDNSNGEYYSLRGKCYLELNNPDLAKISLEKAIKLLPNNFDNFQLLGSCYSKAGDFTKALIYFDESIELLKHIVIDPRDKEVIDFSILCEKAVCFMNLLKFEELKTLAQEVKNLKEKKYYGFYLESIAFSRLHDHVKALECINKSLAINETHDAFAQRSRIQLHNKNFEYALEDITKALAIDNVNIEYLLLRNEILIALNRESFDIEKIIANESSTNKFYKLISIGKNFKLNDDVPNAKKYFILASNLDKINLIDKITLAYCFSTVQEYDRAIHFISEAIEKKENDTDLLLVRMGYFLVLNKLNEVLKDLNKLINLDSENPEYYDSRWAIYMEMKLYSHAIQDLEKLIILQPHRQDELYALIKTIRIGPTYTNFRSLMTRLFKKITGKKEEDFE